MHVYIISWPTWAKMNLWSNVMYMYTDRTIVLCSALLLSTTYLMVPAKVEKFGLLSTYLVVMPTQFWKIWLLKPKQEKKSLTLFSLLSSNNASVFFSIIRWQLHMIQKGILLPEVAQVLVNISTPDVNKMITEKW